MAGDYVLCVAGMEGGDGYDGEVEGVGFAGDDGLETGYGVGGLDDGIEGSVGRRGMRLATADVEAGCRYGQ